MLLGAELLDELVSGAWIAAWPQVRADLALSYVEVGLLLSAPAIVASLVEPAFGFLGDAGRRRALVRGGGVAFVASLVLVALSPGFWPLLAALAVLYPATGAFVGLSQATLMDAAPEARERNMARWVLAGSVGALAGPLLVGAMARGGLGWR
ncbi:MAG TPA: MFS transporter, partial [Gemmatimonadaceae bacterium]|nr:MFS transporter [Gemmatimonadaceae bacterium]